MLLYFFLVLNVRVVDTPIGLYVRFTDSDFIVQVVEMDIDDIDVLCGSVCPLNT
jgi:hypothetical protein